MKKIQKDLKIADLKKLHKGTLTDDIVLKLEQSFQNDFTNEEASRYVGIHPDTYYNYCKWSTEFRDKMDRSKQFVAIAAKNTWAKAVRGGDVEASIKWLERRQKKLYSLRSEITGENGGPISIKSILDEIDGRPKI